MVLPEEVSALLRKHELARYQADPDDHECDGAKFHSPRPLRLHAYLLPDKHLIYLCGTCRDNLAVYLFLWDAESGLPWSTQREFGNKIRNLANRILEAKRASND